MIRKRGSWGEGELYEALCLLMIGACLWIIGIQFQVFSSLNAFIHANDLSNAFMLVALMGLAVFAASLRKSLLLRVAMRERDLTAAEAEAVARHDVLTGLANRRLFLETLERRRAAASLVPTQAVLLVDLDRFKPVNDIYGHAAGNAVLCAVAERLSALTPEGGLAARLGGDEFALLVPLEAAATACPALAQAVIAPSRRRSVAGQRAEGRRDHRHRPVTSDQADADVVLHAADLAMYQGKKDGRGVFRVFKSAMDHELEARAQLESELRAAIANGEIEPFYQPVVTLPEKTLVGVEVLARWRHPVRGLLAPASFIGIAEETGLISELSMKLLRQACLDARDWPSHFQLAINIAPQQFQDRLAVRAHPRDPHRDRLLPEPPGGRDHRDGLGPGSGGGPHDPDLAAEPRRAHRPRRLRHGLFQPLPPARAEVRQAQDRPHLRRQRSP